MVSWTFFQGEQEVNKTGFLFVLPWFFLSFHRAEPGEKPIILAKDPSISPAGDLIAFSWKGDIWIGPSTSGSAYRLTWSDGEDYKPLFSPDGKRIAFTSKRWNSTPEVFVLDLEKKTVKQLTFHSEGATAIAWFPDGKRILTRGVRDRTGDRVFSGRFYVISSERRGPEKLLFDTYAGSHASISESGKKVLFTREGMAFWRKGYKGSKASQVWLYDMENKEFKPVAKEEGGCRWPLFLNEDEFLYVSQADGTFNIWKGSISRGTREQVTRLVDDGVQFPSLSPLSGKVVFRSLFRLYLLDLDTKRTRRIDLTQGTFDPEEQEGFESYTRAESASFTWDGKQIAFIAGGDVWVMDTKLREPVNVTRTKAPEKSVCFLPSGNALFFTSLEGGHWDIWEARPKDPRKWFWLNKEFVLRRITTDPEMESGLHLTPDGKKMAFVKGNGDVWLMDLDGRNQARVLSSWTRPQFAFSPDCRWMAYSIPDPDDGYSRNVWIMDLSGRIPAFNVSAHPNSDSMPCWSQDGRMLAWVTNRANNEADICFVYLRKEDEERPERDKKLEEALKFMKGKTGRGTAGRPGSGPAARKKRPKESHRAEAKVPEVRIDFEGMRERIHLLHVEGGTESFPFFGPDSKNIYFSAVIDGKMGLYSVRPKKTSVPGFSRRMRRMMGGMGLGIRPRKVGSAPGRNPVWLRKARCFGWLASGKPGTFAPPAGFKTYSFKVYGRIDGKERFRYGFYEAWRIMRDVWYDPGMNNRDWDKIREKYIKAASLCQGNREFKLLVELMLGELNGSHLGFFAPGSRRFRRMFGAGESGPSGPRVTTWHLGLIWDRSFKGPGLRVEKVVPSGPSDRKEVSIRKGDIVLSIDGKKVDASRDLAVFMNRIEKRPFDLVVLGKDGKERKVSVYPATYGEIRRLLFRDMIERRRKEVEKLSGGKLGYILVEAMNIRSFEEFQEGLYKAGYGKKGLIIDVRNNGGGHTADLLLTALCQPRHAITIPRGGKPGYPRDRIVYARWNKPIVVLCNQNSFSNAEIFSHAIKTLERGKLVGVRTAGGVISTGVARVLDVGFLRTPARGWFLLKDGRDMELNGAEPDFELWLKPGEELDPTTDRQLHKAVQVLLEEVKAWGKNPLPPLEYASQRI